jgi:hypothetical protein
MSPGSFWVLALVALQAVACAPGDSLRPVPFRPPEAYPNRTQVEGAVLAAQAFDHREEAREAFGFDILGAGLLPIQVVLDNRGRTTWRIDALQCYLEDRQGRFWPVLDQAATYARAGRLLIPAGAVSASAAGGLAGAAVGTVVGAALGIAAGSNVGEAAGQGAALGAATGVALGALGGPGGAQARSAIASDLKGKTLHNRPVPPGALAHGFLFFPAEAGKARQLRLQLRDAATGGASIHLLPLAPRPESDPEAEPPH